MSIELAPSRMAAGLLGALWSDVVADERQRTPGVDPIQSLAERFAYDDDLIDYLNALADEHRQEQADAVRVLLAEDPFA